jgi:hypothetical protein
MHLSTLHPAGASMKRFSVEQSGSEHYTSHSGLGLVGMLLNDHTSLCRRAEQAAYGSPSVSHADVIRTYVGLLSIGKSDFEAVSGAKAELWFKTALGIRKVPSAETLRQRLDRHAGAFAKVVPESSIELLKSTRAPLTALPGGHVPLDLDVFTMDNSDTKKEGVSFTYQGFCGYAPIAAYLGEEGWCIGMELREGSQHGQTDFIVFLEKTIAQARKLTSKRLLVRADSAHDAVETLVALEGQKRVDYIVKWNPRSTNQIEVRDKVFGEGSVSEPRPGKKVGVLATRQRRQYKGKTCFFTLLLRATERTTDRTGQMLLAPRVEIEGWWTSLSNPEEAIELYKGRGKSEQFHSEIKTDLDLERLPSGKFATNSLVLSLGGLVYNLLRVIGQFGLLGPKSPVRHRAKRRRIRTVLQEIMYVAARLVRTGRRLILRFGRHCPAFDAYRQLHVRFSPA